MPIDENAKAGFDTDNCDAWCHREDAKSWFTKIALLFAINALEVHG